MPTQKSTSTKKSASVTKPKTRQVAKPKSKVKSSGGGTVSVSGNTQDQLRRKLIDRGMSESQAKSFAKNATKKRSGKK